MSRTVIIRSIAWLTLGITAVLVLNDQFVASFSVDDGQSSATVAQQSSSALSVAPANLVSVVRVVDGDTFAALVDGKEEKVRMLGINAPESVDPRRKVECFGKEASAELHLLLDGKSVELVSDTTQDDRDKYNRLLRYVALADGSDVGAMMIKEGFAYEYTYRLPYERQKEYKQFQSDGETSGKGLWAKSACDGKK